MGAQGTKWEWRFFSRLKLDESPSINASIDGILHGFPLEIRDDWYMILEDPALGLKIRSATSRFPVLELKIRHDVRSGGFERWSKRIRVPITLNDNLAGFPPVSTITPILDRLMIHDQEYKHAVNWILDELANLEIEGKDPAWVKAAKQRQQARVDECLVERTTVEMNGKRYITCAVEGVHFNSVKRGKEALFESTIPVVMGYPEFIIQRSGY
ncbi:hypothetical protein GF325_03515 [Candidatus Bathyarchaeota archaeon]|nr:hypothetical protein [Candidatus Bathyarchaeota archaeon]